MICYEGKNYMYENIYVVHPLAAKLLRQCRHNEAYYRRLLACATHSRHLCGMLQSSMLHFLFLFGLRLHALVFQQFLGICHIIALRVACSSREWQRGQV